MEELIAKRNDTLTAAGLQSSQQLEVIFETMQAGIILVNPQGMITFANRRMAAMFGYPLEELIGTSYPAHVHPDQRTLGDERMRRLISGEIDHVHNERHFIRRDGRDFWGHLSGRRLEDANGNLTSLVGVVSDITEMKQVEKALRASEQKFSKAFNHAPLLMTISDMPTGRYLEVNNKFCEVSGFSHGEAVGRTSVELGWISVAERERLIGILERDGRVLDIEIQLAAKGGRPVVCLYSAEIIDVAGSDRLLSIALDITRRKKDQEDLDYANRCFAQALNGGQHVLYRLNVKHGGYDYLSPAFERITGYELAEFSKIRFEELSDLFHPDDHQRIFGQIEEALRTRTGRNVNFDLEYRFRKADGSYCWFHDITTAVMNEQNELECFFGSVSDITDRVLLQQEQEKNQRLESLGLLAGGIAHDFNNILTGIVGNLSLARMMIANDHRAAGRLEQCEQAAKRASELTQQLLTFARGGEPVKKVVDVARLVNEAVSFALHGSSVKGALELPGGLWLIDADEGQISQALNNLLINAVQAMPEGGTVTVRGENRISDNGAPLSGRHVRLIVSDTGIGIPSDQLAKIFDPYFTTKKSGTGLGLASVHSIVTRHGGTVTVSSQPGAGTEFVICLPAAGELPAVESDEQGRPVAGLLDGSRVLVMDDDEMICDVAGLMLTELGCLPELCSEGEAAVKLYREALEQGRPYHAVILDLTVPGGMGGLEAARRIRELDGKAQLLVSSGYSTDAVIADLDSHGFSGAVTKPYTLQNLSDELGRVLGSRA